VCVCVCETERQTERERVMNTFDKTEHKFLSRGAPVCKVTLYFMCV